MCFCKGQRMVTCALSMDIESRELDRRSRSSLSKSMDFIPQSASDHSLTVLESGCNHEGILTFTIILEICSPIYKSIYFIEFTSELWRRTHGNVFLRFYIVYCSQGNREQPAAHYLKRNNTKTQENVSVCTGPIQSPLCQTKGNKRFCSGLHIEFTNDELKHNGIQSVKILDQDWLSGCNHFNSNHTEICGII